MRTRAFRKVTTPEEVREVFDLIDESLSNGALRHIPLDWCALFRVCEEVAEEHLVEIGARTGDLLHVASAVVLQADKFVTFDLRQAKLAQRAGLKVKVWH